MEPTAISTPARDEIREQQRATWNKFSGGWKKWDELTMQFLRPAGEAIINAIPLKDNYTVLDLASGTGEPAMTIAAKVKQGKVIATDVAEDMLKIAEQNARAKGLTNFETKVCSADALPFDAEQFDAISCRMGYMFFPDVAATAKEMHRVLKSGGYLATSVWASPEKNPWASILMNIIQKNIQMPTPPPGSPGLFRCGKPGHLKSILEQAGFHNVQEQEVNLSMDSKSFEEFWSFQTEVAAPVVAALGKADEQTRIRIKEETREATAKFSTGDGLKLPAISIILTAIK